MVCCWWDFGQGFHDIVRASPFFFLRRKKNSKRKSCKGDAPLTPAVWGRPILSTMRKNAISLTPAVWGRHHNRMWKQWGGVSTGRTTRTGQSSPFKRPAANNLCGGIVPHGSLTDGFSTNTATFFAVHFTSVAAATGRTRSLGVSGGGAALSFDSHRGSAMRVGTLAAAQPPECAFLRRFRASGFCCVPLHKQRMPETPVTQSETLCIPM